MQRLRDQIEQGNLTSLEDNPLHLLSRHLGLEAEFLLLTGNINVSLVQLLKFQWVALLDDLSDYYE
jgi:hypothetical protein